MAWFEIALKIVPLINILLAVVIIFVERKDVNTTLTWLMVLLLLPVLGFFLYLLFGQNLSRHKIFKLKAEEEKLLKNNMLSNKEYIKNSKIYSSNEVKIYRKLINLYIHHNIATFSDNNKIEIYTDGNKKFDALFKAIAEAKDYIFLEYFIFKNDDIGTKLRNALVEKARSGVEVKLLYDRLGSRFIHKRFLKPLIEAGGKIAVFFPSKFKMISLHINYRNHRKIVVIDDRIGFVGGMNIGDEYLGKSKKFGGWRDTHLRIDGDAVDSLKLRFLLDWRYATGEDLYFTIHKNKKTEQSTGVPMQIVASGPNSQWETIKFGFLSIIGDAKESIYIQTPYLIPDEGMRELLKVAVLSGVDVRIMIPNMPDHPFVYWATYHYAGELLKLGAKIYIYQKGFMHAKNIIVDKKIVSVGTTNMDIRSFRINFEVNAFIYDLTTASEFHRIFMKDIENSTELTVKQYENRKLTIKIKESISRLLSPIL